GRDAVFQQATGSDHVFMRTTRLDSGVRGYTNILLSRQPRCEIDVVRCKVLGHPDVCDASRERTLAARGDLVDLTELSGVQPLLEREECRIEPLDVSDSAHQ